MSKHTKLWTTAAFLVAFASPSFAEDTTVDTVVASVNGQDITLGHLIVARGELPPQYAQLPDDVLFQGLLDNLVQQTILAQSVTEPLPKAVQLSLDNSRRGALAGTVINDAIGDAITEEAIAAEYAAMIADMEPAMEFNASHILVETEDEAKELVKTLEGGADFAELAKEKSTGPSGPNGGSLSWFGKGAMVPSFEAALLELEVGGISAPVETQFGWHVIILNETRDTPAPSQSELGEQIAGELQRKAVDARIAELTEGQDIVLTDPALIDPALLSTLSLTAE